MSRSRKLALLALALMIAGSPILAGRAWAECPCQATSNCIGCGGSGGGTWTPTCGAGGPPGATCVCTNGNCFLCSSCCVATGGGSLSCSCARCYTGQGCYDCNWGFGAGDEGDHGGVPTEVNTMESSDDARIPVAIVVPPHSVAVTSVRVDTDEHGTTRRVTFDVRNDSSLPLLSFILQWKLLPADGSSPVTFTASFDSWGLGTPIEPGETFAATPRFGVTGAQAVKEIRGELLLAEFKGGPRMGRAAGLDDSLLNERRQAEVAVTRAFALVLFQEGLQALRQRVDEAAYGACGQDAGHGIALRLAALLRSGHEERVIALLRAATAKE